MLKKSSPQFWDSNDNLRTDDARPGFVGISIQAGIVDPVGCACARPVRTRGEQKIRLRDYAHKLLVLERAVSEVRICEIIRYRLKCARCGIYWLRNKSDLVHARPPGTIHIITRVCPGAGNAGQQGFKIDVVCGE